MRNQTAVAASRRRPGASGARGRPPSFEQLLRRGQARPVARTGPPRPLPALRSASRPAASARSSSDGSSMRGDLAQQPLAGRARGSRRPRAGPTRPPRRAPMPAAARPCGGGCRATTSTRDALAPGPAGAAAAVEQRRRGSCGRSAWMTRPRSGRSRPRAATSVATQTRARPSRRACSASRALASGSARPTAPRREKPRSRRLACRCRTASRVAQNTSAPGLSK